MLTVQTETMRPLPPLVLAAALTDWRTAATEAYRRSERNDVAVLRGDLATRVASLTGIALLAEQIDVDRTARQATARLDGVLFRLRAGRLAIVRPCSVCGLGAFASPAIHNRADLGYALEGWEPRCPFCGADDDEDWSFSW